jgi:hypothetical protein
MSERIPAAITFTGTVEFTSGCEACRQGVQRFVAHALAQSNVRSVTLRSGSGHAHETEPPPPPKRAAKLADATGDPATLFPSDTNGSAPEDVQRHLDALR